MAKIDDKTYHGTAFSLIAGDMAVTAAVRLADEMASNATLREEITSLREANARAESLHTYMEEHHRRHVEKLYEEIKSLNEGLKKELRND